MGIPAAGHWPVYRMARYEDLTSESCMIGVGPRRNLCIVTAIARVGSDRHRTCKGARRMTADIWEYCGNTADYPEATRCYCCSLNIFHSREEHDKILAEGWKSRPHVEKVRKEYRTPLINDEARARAHATAKRRREFHDLIWKAL